MDNKKGAKAFLVNKRKVNQMSKYSNDSVVLNLQHQLAIAKYNEKQAHEDGSSDDVILMYMEQVDYLVSELLSHGCHLRDCH